MANTHISAQWAALEATMSFLRAWGPRRRLRLSRDTRHGCLSVAVEVAPTDDFDEMRRRLVRAGRMLADEAMRKRLRSCVPQSCPSGAIEAAEIRSVEHGVAMRAALEWNETLGRPVWRLDMLGARYAAPKAS